MTWNCHADDLTKGGYEMILGRDPLTELGLNLKLSDHNIKADDGPLKGLTETMFDMGTYEFESLYFGKIKPEELFMNAYT